MISMTRVTVPRAPPVFSCSVRSFSAAIALPPAGLLSSPLRSLAAIIGNSFQHGVYTVSLLLRKLDNILSYDYNFCNSHYFRKTFPMSGNRTPGILNGYAFLNQDRKGGSGKNYLKCTKGRSLSIPITASVSVKRRYSSMIEFLDRQQALTGRQDRLVVTTIIAQMLEFFDFFLIGFVLVVIIGPWDLTYGESAVILLASGIGALFGSIISGALADVVGRRKIFIATIITFSLGTGILIFTPTGNWLFLSAFRV